MCNGVAALFWLIWAELGFKLNKSLRTNSPALAVNCVSADFGRCRLPRCLVRCWLAPLPFLLLWCSVTFASSGDQSLFLMGADLSLLPVVERAGVVFKDGGKPGDAIQILASHGLNCVRLRLFVHPNGKLGMVNDLPYTIALAQRAKRVGLQLYLDIHYSDGWADPGHQAIPEAWKSLSFDELLDEVRSYTRDVVASLSKQGAAPDYVSIGNEITNGMMWPAAHLRGGAEQAAAFDRLCKLLDAGINGVHQGALNNQSPKIIIHIDRAGKAGLAEWFFNNVTARHVPFDIIGLSYYPFDGRSVATVQASLNSLANTFGKPIIIAEVSFPWADAGGGLARKHLAWSATPEGQKACLKDVIAAMKAVPHHLGCGVFWWYAESIPVSDPAAINWWNGQCALFDRQGNSLPAVDAFKDAGL